MRILIVRHGETNENVPLTISNETNPKTKGIIQGRLDTVLNDIGLQQSRLVAKALKDIPFTHAYCSPLKRASQTYDEIARHRNTLRCVIQDDIVEYHCGRLQGITRKQALTICKEEGISYEHFRSQGGAESRGKVCTRIAKFWKTEILPLRKTEAIVLLVSHGGIISVLRKYLIGDNYRVDNSLVNSKNDFWEVRNCSITEIQLGEKGPGEFIRMGDWEHIIQEGTAEYTKEPLENSTG